MQLLCVVHTCLPSEYDLNDSCFIGIQMTSAKCFSRNSTCRTWHLLPHPDAVAAVRVCRPSPRTGTDESVLVVCVASDKLGRFFTLPDVAG